MVINNVSGQQVKFKIVDYNSIDKMMERDVEPIELFIDDKGILYIVSRGDLTLYELRHTKKETQEKINQNQDAQRPNMFLEENEFELF